MVQEACVKDHPKSLMFIGG